MEKEIFYFDSELKVETFEDNSKPKQIVGYAMKFNILSHDRGGYRDVFRKDVFGKTVQGSDGFDTKAYYDHETTAYLGRVSNNTLTLSTDDVGLRFSIDIPDTSLGRDVAYMIDRGDIPGCSFGYIPEDYTWNEQDRGTIREHTKGTLVEVSVVHDPAFPFTEVALASLDKWKAERQGTPLRNSAKRILQLNGEKFE